MKHQQQKTRPDKEKETIALILLDKKAVTLSPKEPYTFASGIKSPIYCDNRLLLSYPKERDTIVESFLTLMKEFNLEPDVICGTATAGIPWASFIADSLDKPLIYARSKPKEHGKENIIEGRLEKGQKVIVVEDLISTGASSLNAVENVRGAGGNVLAVIAIFTYGMKKAETLFGNAFCTVHTLTDFPTLIEIAVEQKYIDVSEKELVLRWAQEPDKWGKDNEK